MYNSDFGEIGELAWITTLFSFLHLLDLFSFFFMAHKEPAVVNGFIAMISDISFIVDGGYHLEASGDNTATDFEELVEN